uniref:Uncharacterized protein n=1 Tax=Arundo donax TaxID=35708 RepID=A0A0A9BG47_ARUDO
MINKSVFKKIN